MGLKQRRGLSKRKTFHRATLTVIPTWNLDSKKELYLKQDIIDKVTAIHFYFLIQDMQWVMYQACCVNLQFASGINTI